MKCLIVLTKQKFEGIRNCHCYATVDIEPVRTLLQVVDVQLKFVCFGAKPVLVNIGNGLFLVEHQSLEINTLLYVVKEIVLDKSKIDF